MSEENKAIVRRVEETWSSGNLEALEELFAPDYVNHAAMPGMPQGLEGAKLAHQASVSSFPDRRVVIEDMIAEGDRVVVRCRMTGTNMGGIPWAGIPANEKKLDVQWISVYRIREGRVAESWGLNDIATFMQQMGAMPGPGG